MAGEFGLDDIIFIEYIFIVKLHIFDFLQHNVQLGGP